LRRRIEGMRMTLLSQAGNGRCPLAITRMVWPGCNTGRWGDQTACTGR
jgi:hypothetical protein